jgi:protein SCO1/2
MTAAKSSATEADQEQSAAQPLPAWIRWGRFIVPVLMLALLGGALFLRANATPRELKGGALVPGRQLAADFSLVDQFGQPQQLSSFRGKPVALTFLYTNCIDVCPLIAWNMGQAYAQLGADAKNVQLLAVSVDPEHDTPAQIRAFSDQRQLTDKWRYLTGNRPVLEDVWKAYGLPVQTGDTLANGAEEIEHAAPTLLIDKHGYVRALLPVDFTAETLADNFRVLLAEQ